ncbi:MAG: hypothetical protein KAJ62_05805 [Desulfobacteraceae bacterium]|nr:hypothetical protein [Desulfobacteraceae bacterium]
MRLKLVLWLIFVILLLLHFIILFTHGSLLFIQKIPPSYSVMFYYVIIFTICAVFITGMIKRNIRQKKSFTLFCSVAIVLMTAGLAWFLMDAPPLKDDYVKEDIIYKANGSYQYLNVFNKADVDVLKKANQKLGEGYKGKISIKAFDQVWEEIKDYRHAIDALDKFDVICDLPEGTEIDMEVPFMHYSALKEITKIYRKYFLLKLSQGKGEEAAEHLCRIHRVTRKGMADSTILINKIIFSSLVMHTMDTAYLAILNKQCDKKLLDLLKENFTPLDMKELSFKRTIIAEYLLLKNTIKGQLLPETFLDSFTMAPGIIKEEKSFDLASYFVYYFGFRPNKSLSEMRKYFELLLKAQEAFPVNSVQASHYLREYSKTPPIRNMVGWILNTIATPSIGNFYKRVEITKIKSDLLALTLHKRLKQPIMIKDIYTKDPYNYREKDGFLQYPGQDGKFDNEDDIILGMKPAQDN